MCQLFALNCNVPAAVTFTHGTFNFTLCDGQALYAHASTNLYWLERAHPFLNAQLVDRDLSLDLGVAHAPGDRMALIATEPLTRNERWVPFAAGELRVFADGEAVWQRAPATSPALDRSAPSTPTPTAALMA